MKSCGVYLYSDSKLTAVKFGIEAVLLQQRMMRALFNDIAVFHYEDEVSFLNGGKTVRYNKAGTSLHHFAEC